MIFDYDAVIVHDHPIKLHYCLIRDPLLCSTCEQIKREEAEYAKTCPTCSTRRVQQ